MFIYTHIHKHKVRDTDGARSIASADLTRSISTLLFSSINRISSTFLASSLRCHSSASASNFLDVSFSILYLSSSCFFMLSALASRALSSSSLISLFCFAACSWR